MLYTNELKNWIFGKTGAKILNQRSGAEAAQPKKVERRGPRRRIVVGVGCRWAQNLGCRRSQKSNFSVHLCIRQFFLLFLFLVGSLDQAQAFSKIPLETTLHAPQTMGVRTLEYVDVFRRDRPVHVELWYPAEGFSSEKEVRGAPFAETKAVLPLIIMSHGHRGDRRDRLWLAESLVANGYIVASVEHYGNTRSHYDPLLSLCFWERARDISFALDRLGRDTTLRTRIDWSRIGFVGYSLGGMTGLSLAGAVATHVKEKLLEEPETLHLLGADRLAAFDFTEAEKDYTEPRIKSFLLLCPATHVYSSRSLQKIKAKVALVVAVNDEILPHEQHGYRLMKNLSPHRLKVLGREISHYVFLHSGIVKNPLKKQRETQEEVSAFAVHFFDETLLDQPSSQGF